MSCFLRWLAFFAPSSPAIARTSQLLQRQLAEDATLQQTGQGVSAGPSRSVAVRQRISEVTKQLCQVIPSGDHEVIPVGGEYYP